MKNIFPGHFRPSEEEYATIWAEALIVPDTNVLLNMYRYSEKTSDEFISVLEGYSLSLWIPYRVAEEFFSRRTSVISGQVKRLNEIRDRAKLLHSDLNPGSQHPLVDSDLAGRYSEIKDEIIAQLDRNATKQRALIHADSVLSRLAELFSDEKIGPAYEKNRLDEILKDGAVRYAEKIPPGYKDSGKAQSSGQSNKQDKKSENAAGAEGFSVSFVEKCRPFGDLIIWMQLIDKAGDIKRPVIFITDDAKEDWWEKSSGLTVGPRPELVKEFLDKAGQKIVLYSPEQFLTIANKLRNQNVTAAAISEVKELSEQAAEAEQFDRARITYISSLSRQMAHLNNEKDHLQRKIDSYTPELSEIFELLKVGGAMRNFDPAEIGRLEARREQIHSACMDIMYKVQALDREVFNLQVDIDMRNANSHP
ncbi:hypothetical protein ABIC11_001095 [Pseudomonas oryzihabitans]